MEKTIKKDIIWSFVTSDGRGHIGVYDKEKNVVFLVKEGARFITDENGAFLYPTTKYDGKIIKEKVELSPEFEALVESTYFDAGKYSFKESDLANFRKLCNKSTDFTLSSLVNIENSFNSMMKAKDKIDFNNEWTEKIQELDDAEVIDEIIPTYMYEDVVFDKRFSKKNVCYFEDDKHINIGLYKKLCDSHYDKEAEHFVPETKRVFVPSSGTTYTVANDRVQLNDKFYDLKFNLKDLSLREKDVAKAYDVSQKDYYVDLDASEKEVEEYNKDLDKKLYTLNELAYIEEKANTYRARIHDYERKLADKRAHSVYSEF